MGLRVSKVKVSRKRVKSLHTRGMHHSCDEVVCGSASECVFPVSLVNETSDEQGNHDNRADKGLWFAGLMEW